MHLRFQVQYDQADQSFRTYRTSVHIRTCMNNSLQLQRLVIKDIVPLKLPFDFIRALFGIMHKTCRLKKVPKLS